MDMSQWLSQKGVSITIKRNNAIICETLGLFNHEKSNGSLFIGFMPEIDVAVGDYLITANGEIFHAKDMKRQFINQRPYQLKVYVYTHEEYSQQKNANSQVTYNISNAIGSIIGNHNVNTLNYTNSSIAEMREKVSNAPLEDREELSKLIDLLEMVVEDKVPASKGLFSRFSAVMERNSWITSSITNAVMSWLLSRLS